MPANYNQTVNQYGHLFDALLIEIIRVALIPRYDDELANGGQQLVGQPTKMWSIVWPHLVPQRTVLRLKVQLQLTAPNVHKACHKLTKICFVILQENVARV